METQGKTIREWLEELPEPYRGQALENARSGLPRPLNSVVYSKIAALRAAFNWMDSPQGHGHWNEFADTLLGNIPLPENELNPASEPTESQKQTALLTEIRDLLRKREPLVDPTEISSFSRVGPYSPHSFDAHTIPDQSPSVRVSPFGAPFDESFPKSDEPPKAGDWGWFWDETKETALCGRIESIETETRYPFFLEGHSDFKNFSRTPPAELVEALAKGGWKLERIQPISDK